MDRVTGDRQDNCEECAGEKGAMYAHITRTLATGEPAGQVLFQRRSLKSAKKRTPDRIVIGLGSQKL